jgi:hypothetical protein
MIEIRHKNIDLEWYGYPILCKAGEFLPLKLCYNGTAGWWVNRRIFLSYNQVKKVIKKFF